MGQRLEMNWFIVGHEQNKLNLTILIFTAQFRVNAPFPLLIKITNYDLVQTCVGH